MSCLPKATVWSGFKAREILFPGPSKKPEAELLSVFRHYRACMQKMTNEKAALERHWLEVLAEVGTQVFNLGKVLEEHRASFKKAGLMEKYDHLCHIHKRLVTAYESGDIQLLNPIGAKYSLISQLVEIEAWVHKEEYTDEIVIDVIEPAILYNNILVRLGRVLMGAPPTGTAPQTTETPNQFGDKKNADEEQGDRNRSGHNQ